VHDEARRLRGEIERAARVEDAEQLFCVRATNLYEKTNRYEVFEFKPS